MTAPTLMHLSPSNIIESPDNPRKHFDPAFVTRMAKSMREVGQLTAVTVRLHPKQSGKYELAAGATRLRAAKEAGLTTLLANVQPYDDTQFLEVLTFENLERKDLRPLEEARSYALLMKRLDGYTPDVIAKRSGVSVDYVRDRLRLLKLCPEAIRLVDADRIPLTHALELAKLTLTQQEAVVDPDGEGADYGEGMWRFEDAGGETLFDADAKKKDRYAGRTLCSLRELRHLIASAFPVDLSADSTPDLFPEMVAAVKKAEETAVPVVHICDEYSAPTVEEGEPRILSNKEWRRADGTKGAPTCKYATTLGVGRIGRIRGQAFAVCVARTECRKHFGDDIRHEEQQRAAKAASKGSPGKTKEEPWQRKQRLDQEARAAFKPVSEPLREAIKTAIETASTKVGGALDKLVARDRAWSTKKGGIPRGTTPEDLMRYLAWREVGENEWNAHTELPRIARSLGIDVAAIVKAHAPAKAVKGKAPRAAKAA